MTRHITSSLQLRVAMRAREFEKSDKITLQFINIMGTNAQVL